MDIVEAEWLADFLLKKPQQTVGISHKRYSLKKSSGPIEMKLFVSHSHLDRQVVEELIVQPLQSLGVKTWYALDDIPKASLWPAEIRKGLAECTCMIVVVSKNASGSDWVRLEVDLAVGLGRMQGKIMPLRLDDTPPHTVNEYLVAVQGIDARTTPKLGPEILKFVQTVSRR